MVYLLNMMMFHVAKCFLNDQRVISYIWRATRALSAGTSAAGLWWPWLSTASAAHERPGSDIGHPQIHCQNSPSPSSRWCLSRSNLHGEASTSWPWNFHGWASFPISCTGCLRIIQWELSQRILHDFAYILIPLRKRPWGLPSLPKRFKLHMMLAQSEGG